MLDVLEFRAPLGPLGRVAEALALRHYLRRMLETRNAMILKEVEART